MRILKKNNEIFQNIIFKIAKEYKNERKDVIISHIEGKVNGYTFQRFEVFIFPFIALFKSNNNKIFFFSKLKKL